MRDVHLCANVVLVNATKTLRVAANVRAELARRNIPAQSLAEAVDLNRATLGRRLNGYSSFTIDELDRIADYFGLPLEVLISDGSVGAA